MVKTRKLLSIWIMSEWLIMNVFGSLDNRIYQKRCNDNRLIIFHTTTVFALDECLSECHLRTRCFGTRYNNHYRHCSLLDALDLDSLQAESPGCLFTNISQWEPQNIGPCVGHNCSTSEVCIPVNLTDHECVTSHCEFPPIVANARTLAGTQIIEARNRYICNTGFSPVGDPVVTCQENGQWSQPNFFCVKQCRRPKVSHFNAYLVGADLVNNFAPGTKLYFRCKEGFASAETVTENVCNGKSNWNKRIQCCSDDKYHYRTECFLPFGHGAASSFQEMQDHCQSLDGWVGKIHKNYAEHIEAMGVAYDLLINSWRKQDYETHQNLTSKCLVPNFGSNLDQFADMSYDDIIHYIKDNFASLDTDDNHCSWAERWLPDIEPNGGDSEPCTFLQKSDGYQGFGDITCNFQNLNVGFVCHFLMDRVD